MGRFNKLPGVQVHDQAFTAIGAMLFISTPKAEMESIARLTTDLTSAAGP